MRCMLHKRGTKHIAIPVALSEKQRMKFAVKWILDASREKAGKKLEVRLAKEMVAIVQGDSKALEKNKEVHKFAMVNRYFEFFQLNLLLQPHLFSQRKCVVASLTFHVIFECHEYRPF